MDPVSTSDARHRRQSQWLRVSLPAWLSVWLSISPGCGAVDDRVPPTVNAATSPGSAQPAASARGDAPAGGDEAGTPAPNELGAPGELGLEGAGGAPRGEALSSLLLPESSVHLGGVGIGQTVRRPVEVVNRGNEPIGVRAELWSGEPLGFAVDEGCNVSLDPGQSCEFVASFSASAPGEAKGAVLVTTHLDETALVELVAEGVTPGNLVVSEDSFIFDDLEMGVGAASHRFVVRNAGGTSTGPLQIVLPVEGSGFSAEHDCPESLGAGASCNFDVTFAPRAAGPRNGFITVTDDGARLYVSMHGTGTLRVTVNRVGQGTVSFDGLDCDDDVCTGLYYPQVMLEARVRDGSGWWFTGFGTRACGAKRSCNLVLDAPLSLVASFREIEHNLAFVGSEPFPASLGGLSAYDRECNRLASAAGINDAEGSAFVAAMSDGITSLRQRLGSARGWVAMDGLAFADSLTSLFDDGQIFYAISHDEQGSAAYANVMTGTEADGSSSDAHCNGWTATTGVARTGLSWAGPGSWVAHATRDCATPSRIICMGTRRSAPLAVEASSGKKIWKTRTPYVPGSMTPDDKCQGERPAGVARAVALTSYTTRPASAVLDPEARYVRTDGIAIGTGAELVSYSVRTGPWLDADGVSGDAGDYRWTGAFTLKLEASTQNCLDWSTSSEAVSSIAVPAALSAVFAGAEVVPCSQSARLTCVEP